MEERYGDRFCAYHRVDLHAGLRELAEGYQGPGQPAKIRLGSEVVGLDAEEGQLKLVDGTTVSKDFVVLADGMHVSLPFPSTPDGVDLYCVPSVASPQRYQASTRPR